MSTEHKSASSEQPCWREMIVVWQGRMLSTGSRLPALRSQGRPSSRPGHADGALEVNPAGPGEGFGYGDVAQVGRGADARHVLRGEDPGAFGEDLIDVSISPLGGQDAELGDDGVVVVAGGDDEASGLAAGQCRDLPPLSRTAVAGEFSSKCLTAPCRADIRARSCCLCASSVPSIVSVIRSPSSLTGRNSMRDNGYGKGPRRLGRGALLLHVASG
jgi:hypothetical protein